MTASRQRRSAPVAALNTYADRLMKVPPDALVPYLRNARTHSNKQIRQIADSIARFGFTNPVLIDDGNMILAGHGRVAAARLLGLDEVPCLRLSAMTEAEKRAYILADNKIAQNAGWDEDLLAIELGYLLSEVEDIDIAVTGFSVPEIDMVLDTGESGTPAADEADDRIPVPATEAVTRPGDVWILGAHRLVCGDARDEAAYRALMSDGNDGAEQAQMVFTDPPYNVRIRGNVSGSGRHREFPMASGEMEGGAFTQFLEASFARMAAWSCDGAIHFICMDWRHIDEISAAGARVYSELKNLIVWVKDNAGMGSFYRSRHELVFAFKNGTAAHVNAFELGQNGRYRTNVWSYRGVTSPTKEAREALALHPTVKPVAMVADAMKDCSQRGGIVLDPFCGSGTILIAAHKTARRARAIELDPLYCDTAVRRWQLFAHDDALLAATGETFDQRAARRASAAPDTTTSIPAGEAAP